MYTREIYREKFTASAERRLKTFRFGSHFLFEQSPSLAKLEGRFLLKKHTQFCPRDNKSVRIKHNCFQTRKGIVPVINRQFSTRVHREYTFRRAKSSRMYGKRKCEPSLEDGQLQASMLCINPSTREMGHASAENTKEGVWRRFRKRMLLRKG